MPDGGLPAAFDACFSDLKIVRTRSVVQIVLEIPIERADAVLAILGGVPQPGKEVSVAVARLMGNDPPVPPRDTEAQRVDRWAPSAQVQCGLCGDPIRYDEAGTPFLCSCARLPAVAKRDALGDGAAGDTQADRSSKSDARREAARDAYWNAEPEDREVKDASILCKEMDFCEFIVTERRRMPLDGLTMNEVKALALAYVREGCGGSRSNIAKDKNALRWWRALRLRYEQNTNRFAEARG